MSRPAPTSESAWMLTTSGRQLNLLDPDPAAISITDIAHGLAHLCRFGGQCRRFYSVAQHAFSVSCACDEHDALWGLLHDATEAYLGDVIQPLKHTSLLASYRRIETRLQVAIAEAFALPLALPASVLAADALVLAQEMRDLMRHCPSTLRQLADQSRPWPLEPVDPDTAREWFLRRFEELTSRRSAA